MAPMTPMGIRLLAAILRLLLSSDTTPMAPEGTAFGHGAVQRHHEDPFSPHSLSPPESRRFSWTESPAHQFGMGKSSPRPMGGLQPAVEKETVNKARRHEGVVVYLFYSAGF